ncbi:UNVERIFIED_CONTAM: hypothetical protein Slati_2543400 [Sesamum latifolium]|uniref:Retrotransposon gag domain-containing protein n=1 Tax=Sesamum latifolium TaxID=2727402 RepID=A0AAW2WFN2_9LAMI
MVELRHQVTKETVPVERGIPFSKHIMTDELPAHFQAPSHLQAYDGTTDTAEHISGSVRSFAEFSSFFQLQFASKKKYRKSVISLFGVKQEENETLIQHFNTVVLEVPAAHQEVLISAFTQGLRGGSLFKSLAKKSATDFLDVLDRAQKYMNLEDA